MSSAAFVIGTLRVKQRFLAINILWRVSLLGCTAWLLEQFEHGTVFSLTFTNIMFD